MTDVVVTDVEVLVELDEDVDVEVLVDVEDDVDVVLEVLVLVDVEEVVVGSASHRHSDADPTAPHAPGHASSPPAVPGSHSSPADASTVPSPQTERDARSASARTRFARSVPLSSLQAGAAMRAFRRTLASVPHAAHCAWTVVKRAFPRMTARVVPHAPSVAMPSLARTTASTEPAAPPRTTLPAARRKRPPAQGVTRAAWSAPAKARRPTATSVHATNLRHLTIPPPPRRSTEISSLRTTRRRLKPRLRVVSRGQHRNLASRRSPRTEGTHAHPGPPDRHPHPRRRRTHAGPRRAPPLRPRAPRPEALRRGRAHCARRHRWPRRSAPPRSVTRGSTPSSDATAAMRCALPSLRARHEPPPSRPAFPAASRARRPAPSAPALDRILVLELSPDLDMEEIAREYAGQPGVVWAEPERIVRGDLRPQRSLLRELGRRGASRFATSGASSDISAPGGVGRDARRRRRRRRHRHRRRRDAPRHRGQHLDEPGRDPRQRRRRRRQRLRRRRARLGLRPNDDNDPFDDHGHGTHVAGHDRGRRRQRPRDHRASPSKRGSWRVKGLGGGGSGTTTDLAEAILYAADNGADVINASWGGFGFDRARSHDAIAAAHAAGVVFVAAAGNATATTPATSSRRRLRTPITVAAFDHIDQIAVLLELRPARSTSPRPAAATWPRRRPVHPARSSRCARAARDDRSCTSTVGHHLHAPRGDQHGGAARGRRRGARPVRAPRATPPSRCARRCARRPTTSDAPGLRPRLRLRADQRRARRPPERRARRRASRAPRRASSRRGSLTVTGTAAGPGFASYALEYGVGSAPHDLAADQRHGHDAGHVGRPRDLRRNRRPRRQLRPPAPREHDGRHLVRGPGAHRDRPRRARLPRPRGRRRCGRRHDRDPRDGGRLRLPPLRGRVPDDRPRPDRSRRGPRRASRWRAAAPCPCRTGSSRRSTRRRFPNRATSTSASP